MSGMTTGRNNNMPRERRTNKSPTSVISLSKRAVKIIAREASAIAEKIRSPDATFRTMVSPLLPASVPSSRSGDRTITILKKIGIIPAMTA